VRAVQLFLHNSGIDHNPLQNLKFDPTNIIEAGQGAFELPNILKLIEAFIRQFLEWFDQVTGIDLLPILNDLEALLHLIVSSGIGTDLKDLATIIEDLLHLFFDGVTILPQILATAVESVLSGASLGDDIKNIISSIISALDGDGAIQTLANLIYTLEHIPFPNITSLFGLAHIGADLQGIVDHIVNGLGVSGTGHVLGDIPSALGAIPGGNISGITAVEQQVVNSICVALGAPSGPNYTSSDVLYYLEHIPASVISGITSGAQGVVDHLVQFLNPTLGTGNPLTAIEQSLSGSLGGLFGRVFGNHDGSASAVSGVTNNSDGTATATAGSGSGGGSPSLGDQSGYSLFDNLDGTAMSVFDLLFNAVGVTGPTTGNLTNSIGNVQLTIDNIIGALGGATSGNLVSGLTSALKAIPHGNLTSILGGADLGADVRSIVDNITNALGLGTGNPVASILTGLEAIPYANLNNILGTTNLGTDLQGVVDKLANAWGQAGTGHTLANLLSYAGAIPNTALTAILGSANLGADVQAIVDKLSNAFGNAGTGHTLANLLTYAEAIPNANITNILGQSSLGADVQAIVDNISNALGNAGTGHTLANLVSYLEAIPAANILGPLSTGIENLILTNLAKSPLAGVVSAVVDSLDGTVQPANVLSALITGNSDGTASLSSTLGATETLLDNLDGTVMSPGRLLQNLAAGVGTQNVTQSIGNVQQIVDNFTNLVTGGSSSSNSLATMVSDLQTSLQGLLPAFSENGDGTLAALVGGIVSNADGTTTTNPVNSLFSIIDAADGTLTSLANAIRNDGGITGLLGTHQHAVNSLQSVLTGTGAGTPANLVSALSNLLPAVVPIGDGTLAAIGGQVAALGDGTVTFAPQQAAPALNVAANSLINNGDGTLMSVADAVQNAVQGANQIGSSLIQGAVGIFGQIEGAFRGRGTASAASAAAAYAAMQGVATTQSANSIQLGGITGLNVSSVNQALQRSGVSVTGGSGGVNTQDNFGTYANANTVTGFTIGQIPGQSANYEPDMGIQSGQVAWTYGSAGNTVTSNVYYNNGSTTIVYNTSEGAYNSTPTNSDYQIVTLVMDGANTINGDPGNSGYGDPSVTPNLAAGWNYLIGRANSGLTSCVYAEIGNGWAALYCVVSGSITLLASVSHTAVMGATYELQLGNPLDTDPYYMALFVNGTTVVSYDDVGHTSQVGSSYRLCGFGMTMQYNNFYGGGQQLYYYPATVNFFGYQDNLTPAAVGSGFRAYRSSTTDVLLSTGKNLLASSFFDVTQYITGDFTYASGTNNKLTVTVAGWYIVKICINLDTTSATGGFISTSLYKNGSVAQQGSAFYIPTAPWSGPTGDTFVLYCASGDTLQPGTWADAIDVNGEATGTQCYWEVTLANCGTLS
jgi:hypothetical protein